MTRLLLIISLSCLSVPVPHLAQVFDDFHDQSLFQGLLWGGDLSRVVTNASRQLQLNADSSGSTVVYFTTNGSEANLECRFWLRENFSPSGLNFSRFYLRSDQSDLVAANNALYLEFGEAGSQDAPKLFIRENGIDSLLAQGPAGSIASAFQLFFKFTYNNGAYVLEVKQNMADASNQWLSGQMPWLPAGPYAGLAFVYTSSNKQNFYLDDLYYGPPMPNLSSHVMITEIMADPEPQQGLPNTEYIELYNAGSQLQQLSGFKLSDATGTCTLPSYWLQPHSYAILVGTGKSAGFNTAKTIEVTAFPSFNNSGELIAIADPQGNESDQINYNLNWYQDTTKQDGGFSLERRSLADPCSAEDNWRASSALNGGTPCGSNSVLEFYPDTLAADLLFAEVRDSNLLALGFSEPMDSSSLTTVNLQFSEDLGNYALHSFSYLQLQTGAQLIVEFTHALPKSVSIQVETSVISECWGNQKTYQFSFIRYELPQVGELLINEILFDPPTYGADFLELYNHSNKYLDLSQCAIGNGLTTYNLQLKKLAPKAYSALCPDTSFLSQNYLQVEPLNLSQQALPYFYNDSGTCILYQNSEILDQLDYKAEWHSALLLEKEGVSLERLSPIALTQDQNNWFSAAQLSGGATPGKPNSQQVNPTQAGALTLSQPELSPDQDGYHDFLEIHYELPAPNMLVQVNIYTLNGQLVRQLSFNELYPTSGLLIWDGSTEYGTIAAPGIYILDFRAFSTDPSVFFNRKLSFASCLKR
ncbi:MAG: lamin tail domain-containing protein [Flavobacteriales bacterium]